MTSVRHDVDKVGTHSSDACALLAERDQLKARVAELELELEVLGDSYVTLQDERLEAQGAAAERRAVVAWLRSDMGQAYEICFAAHEDERYPYRDLADAIERGDHAKPTHEPLCRSLEGKGSCDCGAA